MWTVRRLWQALIALAVVACLANLFGPAGGWWGVDIGAVGSAVFHLALVGSLIVATLRPREIFPDTWAISECRAWVGLVFTGMILLGFGKYLTLLSHLDEVPTTLHALPFRHFQVLLVALFIVWGVTSSVLTYGAGAVESDERDLRLRNEAGRAGDWALTLIVVACVAVLIGVPAAHMDWWLEPLILANVLVGVLIVKAQVECIALVTRYAQSRR